MRDRFDRDCLVSQAVRSLPANVGKHRSQTAWRACYGGDTNPLHGLDDTGATQPVTSGPSQEMSDCCGRLEF